MNRRRIAAGAAALLITMSAAGTALPEPVPCFQANAAGERYTSGGWEYEKTAGGIKLMRYTAADKYYDITLPAELDGQKVTEVSAHILENNPMCYGLRMEDPSVPFDGSILDYSNISYISCPEYCVNTYEFPQKMNGWFISYNPMCLERYLYELDKSYYDESGMEPPSLSEGAKWFLDSFCELVDGEYKVVRSTDITVPSSVAGADIIGIDNWCFYEAEVIDRVILPDTIRILQDGCFMYSSVKEVNIPDGVRFMPDNCFGFCEKLKEPELPDSIISVSDSAFTGTNFNGSAVSIGDNGIHGDGIRMFDRLGDWDVMYLLNADYSISAMPVMYKGKDTVIDYPEKIGGYPVIYDTELYSYSDYESSLLSGCTGVEEIRLPEDLTYLPMLRESFIKTIDIPAGVTEIPMLTFADCNELTSVTIPPAVKNIEVGAFSGCSGLSEVKIEGDSIDIGWECFSRTALKSIELPGNTVLHGSFLGDDVESVTFRAGDRAEIGTNSFCGLKKLRTLEFSPELKEIGLGDGAFRSTGLTELDLGSNIREISHSSFKTCENLKRVTVSGDQRIASEAFMGDMALEKVTLNGIHSIESNAFKECTSLKEVELDLGCSVSSEAFNQCTNLEYINGIKVIGENDTDFAPELSDYIRKTFDGAAGLGFMDTFVMNNVKAVVKEVIDKDMTDIEKAKVLHDWICDHAEYAKSDLMNRGNHADTAVFADGVAVCEGYSRTYNLLLNEAGLQSWYIKNATHAWNIVMIEGKPFHIDTTWDDSDNSDYWFMRTDKEFIASGEDHQKWVAAVPSALHSFQEEGTPECTTVMGDLDGDGDLDTADISELRERLLTGAKYYYLADLDFNGKANAGDLAAAVIRLDSPGLRMGDVDLDGLITSADASLLLDEYARMSVSDGKTFNERQTIIADVNVDGQINAADASAILGYYTYISTGGTDNIAAYTENN